MEARSRSSMPEQYKALAAADLPILGQPPTLINAPLRDMMTSQEATDQWPETLLYTVPTGHQVIVKMVICTSAEGNQDITLRCYTELGPVPLFGPVRLGPAEWAEWSGSLTLGGGSEIRGAIQEGSVSIGIYGLEITS